MNPDHVAAVHAEQRLLGPRPRDHRRWPDRRIHRQGVSFDHPTDVRLDARVPVADEEDLGHLGVVGDEPHDGEVGDAVDEHVREERQRPARVERGAEQLA